MLVKFDDYAFYNKLKGDDKPLTFIKCLKMKKDVSCDSMYSEFYLLGYEDDLVFHDGTQDKLTVMTKPMIVNYLAKNKYDEYLALIVFLDVKDFSTVKFYDNMLEITLKHDSSNIITNYELAKIRYEEGYLGLSHFLIDRMHQVYPSNEEIKRIKQELEKEYGDTTYNKALNYTRYLEFNPHYVTW